jgi:hypothetical protein
MDSGEVGSLEADGADAIIRADKRQPADPEERVPEVLLDAEDTRHLAKCFRVWWKDGEEINTKSRCPGSGHGPARLTAPDPAKEPGWTCVEYMRTWTSKGDAAMRVIFDHSRRDTIILHAVAVRLGLQASGGPQWLANLLGRGPQVQRLQVRGTSPGLEGPQGVDQAQRHGLHDPIGAQRGPGGSQGSVPGNSLGGPEGQP